MKHRDRSEDDLDVPDLYAKGIPSAVKKCELESQHDGVYYGDDNVCNPKGIGIAFSAVEDPFCENWCHSSHAAEGGTVSVCPDPEVTVSFSTGMCRARLR